MTPSVRLARTTSHETIRNVRADKAMANWPIQVPVTPIAHASTARVTRTIHARGATSLVIITGIHGGRSAVERLVNGGRTALKTKTKATAANKR